MEVENTKTNYQMSLIEKLSFTRRGGTSEELRAANILKEEIEKVGGKPEFMEFKLPSFDIDECSLEVVSPFNRKVDVMGYGLSGDIDADLKLVYAEKCTEENLAAYSSLEGCAVIVNQLTFSAYKLLCDKKASAFITIVGKYFDTAETFDMYSRNLRPGHIKIGIIPGFTIRSGDALDILKDGAETIHVHLRQHEVERPSQDVLAVIPGTVTPDESIVLTAHYDSVPVGTGSWDNASGSAALMGLYRHFVKHPLRRTMRFIWCGCEELGLCGSRAYIEQNTELVEKNVKFCFNFDMCGTVLGNNELIVTGGSDLKSFAEQYNKETGWAADINVRVHSSDSAPFADKNIPALGITRRTQTGEIHTKNDVIRTLSQTQMNSIHTFSVGAIERIGNSVTMPINKGMPNDLREALDKRFMHNANAEDKE